MASRIFVGYVRAYIEMGTMTPLVGAFEARQRGVLVIRVEKYYRSQLFKVKRTIRRIVLIGRWNGANEITALQTALKKWRSWRFASECRADAP